VRLTRTGATWLYVIALGGLAAALFVAFVHGGARCSSRTCRACTGHQHGRLQRRDVSMVIDSCRPPVGPHEPGRLAGAVLSPRRDTRAGAPLGAADTARSVAARLRRASAKASTVSEAAARVAWSGLSVVTREAEERGEEKRSAMRARGVPICASRAS
jgi:hypothetical protein